jgi:hypothetical protein
MRRRAPWVRFLLTALVLAVTSSPAAAQLVTDPSLPPTGVQLAQETVEGVAEGTTTEAAVEAAGTVEATVEETAAAVEEAGGTAETTLEEIVGAAETTVEETAGAVEATVEDTTAAVEETATTVEATVEETATAVEEAGGTAETTLEETVGAAQTTVEETAGAAETTAEETAATVEETAGAAEAAVGGTALTGGTVAQGAGGTVENSASAVENTVSAVENTVATANNGAGTATVENTPEFSVRNTTIGFSGAPQGGSEEAGTVNEASGAVPSAAPVEAGEATAPARASSVASVPVTSLGAFARAGTGGSAAMLPSVRQRGSLAIGAPSGYSPIVVVKTNDADGDESFSDSEVAALPGRSVSFKATITNFGEQEVVVTGARDVFPNSSGNSEREVCAGLLGSEIESGETVTCEFTIEDYAPSPGGRVVNTFELAVMDSVDSGNGLTVADISIVRTAKERVLGISFGPGPDSLAETGAAIGFLVTVMLALAGTGGSILQVDRWKLGTFGAYSGLSLLRMTEPMKPPAARRPD